MKPTKEEMLEELDTRFLKERPYAPEIYCALRVLIEKYGEGKPGVKLSWILDRNIKKLETQNAVLKAELEQKKKDYDWMMVQRDMWKACAFKEAELKDGFKAKMDVVRPFPAPWRGNQKEE